MFSCNLCGRAYATQNSLTRHSHNHVKDKSHSCTECHVIFSRRDLLVRHRKIHESSNSDRRPRGRRLRCHTACVNCRRSRTRCDGDGTRPCTSCSDANKECKFSVTSHRVSEDTRITEREHSQYGSTLAEDGANPQSPLGESFDFSAVLQPSNMAQPLEDMNVDGFQTALDPTGFSPTQLTAWPWLHEDLFFQHDTHNDLHRPTTNDLRNSHSAVHPGLPNSSSSPAGDNFSRELLRHTGSEDVSRQLTDNGTMLSIEEQELTFPTHSNRNSTHSKLQMLASLMYPG